MIKRTDVCVKAFEGIPTEVIPEFMACVRQAIYEWGVRQETCGLFCEIERAYELMGEPADPRTTSV